MPEVINDLKGAETLLLSVEDRLLNVQTRLEDMRAAWREKTAEEAKHG